MAEASVEFLLQNLKDLLLYNAHLILDVKEQVNSLYKNIDLFKALLKDAAKIRNKNDFLKTTMNQIRDVVYEAEDIIDRFVSESAARKAQGSIEKTIKKLGHTKARRNVGRDIETISAEVKKIHDDKKEFILKALQQEGEGFAGIPKKREAPIVEEDNVVGFQDEAKKVIKLLTEGSEELEVISIVGMPGLGKTTLAKMMFRDSTIKYEFYNRVWVFVSQEYSRKDVFLNILRHFDPPSDDMYKMDDEELAGKIRHVLEKEKYIIFMDDVWSNEAWDGLKIAFPDKKNGSRILLTTRMKTVARHAKRNLEPHDLRFLDDKESWELLKWKALHSKECPEELEGDGKHIAKECKGLPLAIVVIGGILRDNNNEIHWWKNVARSVDAYIVSDQEKTMANFIEMSFNHLPYHLKACFLYFGMFPEDFQIPVWKLVRLWIAEGFIQEIEGISLEGRAEEYLEDLVNRNLVMVGERRLNGKIKTCHVHDMLHVFCRMQAAEENFFHEIKQFDPSKYSPSDHEWQKHRRLCIHSCVYSYLSSKPIGPNVRSFLCFSSDDFDLPPADISSISGNFELLRVLDGKAIYFPRFPNDLTELIHLRYLVLSCHFKILPETFSRLWNLQTVIVQTSSRTLEIKADIWKMMRLRHLKTNSNTSSSLPVPLLANKSTNAEGSLINGNVRTLSTLSPQSCTQDIFARIPNLKKLGIRGPLANLLNSFDIVGKLDYLENLKLLNDVHPKPPSEGKIARFPQKYQFPPKLNKLTLENTRLDWKHMSTLGMLDSLEILKLRDYAFDGERWQAEDGGFRVLKVLQMGRTNLVTWVASARHFPRLKSLYLRHCSKLGEVPVGLADVSSLQIIDLHRTNKSAAASAMEIQKLKKAMQGQQTNKGREFKLSIFPPDEGQ
ncbi:putative late blight resistance protein homolog R1A-10 [Olea europaea var. sylvestris]|uniref:putative late blight resistance protein homolog R1A-10 n=1 Tax=Olea europaea var. sylvestris TaxID=158386 RepID=UPI000C1D7802|nr:putative late blight resistance protein homolog R1A-10 [Olea europaea var. sylvestris]